MCKVFLSILLVFAFTSSQNSFGQECLTGGCTGGYQFPSTTQSSTTSNWSTVSTLIWPGEYGVYNVTSGNTYQWSLCSSDGGSVSYNAQLTLLNSTGTSTICYSNDNCEVNKPKIQWTATFTGTVRVLVSSFNCVLSGTSATTLVWRCSSCGTGSAPANDNCAGATTLTVGSTCSSTSGSVSGATNSLVSGCVGSADDDVWYKFTTSSAGNYTIRVEGSTGFDAVVELRSGACSGTSVTCVDNTNTGGVEILNATLAASTTYYVRVYDYYSGTPSTTTFNICVFKPDVCQPSYSYGTISNDYINRVQLGSIDNTPAGTGSSTGSSYNDYYSTTNTNIQAGTSATLTVTVGPYGSQTVAAWIDYNNNNIFEASEKLGEVANVGASSSATFNFTVPLATTLGAKRLRVRTVWSSTNILPCDNYSFGEGEDYKVTITSPCTTPGTPTSLSHSSVTNTTATISWAAGSPAGSPTVTYSWAIGSSSSVTYESGYIQRGTTTSLSASLTGLTPGTTYYYRVKAGTSCDGTQSSYTSSGNFTTTCTTPSTPTGLTTYNISTTSATFSWTASSSGSPTIQYSWAVGTGSGVTYESGYTDRGITTSTSVNTFALSPSTTYYWTVKAGTTCNGTQSAYATRPSFITTTVPTPLVTWNGSVSTDWNNSSNWTPNVIPSVTDNVIIPAGCTNYPLITTDGLSINNTTVAKRCKSLHINSGGKITVNGTGLYVYCQGELNISGEFNHQYGSNDEYFRITTTGGIVKVKNGGVLNVGSSSIVSGSPGGTVNGQNDIFIDQGSLIVEPGGTVFIQDALKVQTSGLFKQEGGIVSVALSGFSATNSDKISVSSTSTFRVLGGTLRISGDNDNTATTWDAIYVASGATFDVQGGTIELLNGTTAQDFTITINSASKTINSLTINKPGKSVFLDGMDLTVNGDLSISAGTFNLNSRNLALAGNFTNNGTFTAGSGTATLTGNNKNIAGTSSTTFGSFTIASGGSYSLTGGSSVPHATFGDFTISSGATFNLPSGKIINLAGASNTINGSLVANDSLDGTRDIGFNNTSGTLVVNGKLTADIQVSTGTTTINNSCTINGDVFANTGTLVIANTGLTVNINGSFTNNSAFTANNSTVIFNGTGKTISGSVNPTFNHLQFSAGSSYTINPSTKLIVNGNFTNNGTLTISSTKYLDLYASTASSTSITLNGTITSPSANDHYLNFSREIDINNTVNLGGTGSINADIRIFSGTTTLTSNLNLTGSLEILSGAGFTMTTHTLTAFSFKNLGTFTSGTGTIKMVGSGKASIWGNGNYNGSNKATADLYNLVIDRGSDTLHMAATPLRVKNDFTLTNGVFSTGVGYLKGWSCRRLTVEKYALINAGATFHVGYRRVCGNGDESLSSVPCGGGGCCNSDSLYIPVFKGDLVNYGLIGTSRPIKSGYSDLKITGARVTGLGITDEFAVDIQPEDLTTMTQVGDMYVKGDLIIQSAAGNRFENNGSPDLNLTIEGSLYIYGDFIHNGNVTVHRNMTSSSNSLASKTVAINQSNFTFKHDGGNRFIWLYNKDPIAFGNINIEAGSYVRELRQNITVAGDLNIVSGTLDMNCSVTEGISTGYSNRNITLSGANSNWTNNATFNPRLGTVSFTGSGLQRLDGSSSTTFYNLTVNKSSGSVLSIAKSATVTNTLTLTNGYIESTPSRLITMAAGSSVSPAGGSATSFVRGPIIKQGNTAFVFPVGKNSRWARIGISAPTTSSDFRGEYFEEAYSNITSFTSPITQVSAKEYWLLDRVSGTGNTAVTLYWEDAAWSGINSCAAGGDLLVSRFNGTSWVSHDNPSVTGSCTGSSAGSVTSNTVTSFSPFTFASKTTAFNPLPVSWLNFEATPKIKQVLLNWATGSEINSNKFYIQRSTDGVTFETIDSVNAVGYSISATHYNGIDNNPHKGLNFYRIKQTDVDGAYSYSRIAVVDYAFYEASNTISASLLFPNPTVGNANFAVTSTINQKAQLQVFGLDGRIYINKEVILEPGNNQFILDSESFATGIYVVSLKVTGQTITHKLVKN